MIKQKLQNSKEACGYYTTGPTTRLENMSRHYLAVFIAFAVVSSSFFLEGHAHSLRKPETSNDKGDVPLPISGLTLTPKKPIVNNLATTASLNGGNAQNAVDLADAKASSQDPLVETVDVSKTIGSPVPVMVTKDRENDSKSFKSMASITKQNGKKLTELVDARLKMVNSMLKKSNALMNKVDADPNNSPQQDETTQASMEEGTKLMFENQIADMRQVHESSAHQMFMYPFHRGSAGSVNTRNGYPSSGQEKGSPAVKVQPKKAKNQPARFATSKTTQMHDSGKSQAHHHRHHKHHHKHHQKHHQKHHHKHHQKHHNHNKRARFAKTQQPSNKPVTDAQIAHSRMIPGSTPAPVLKVPFDETIDYHTKNYIHELSKHYPLMNHPIIHPFTSSPVLHEAVAPLEYHQLANIWGDDDSYKMDEKHIMSAGTPANDELKSKSYHEVEDDN